MLVIKPVCSPRGLLHLVKPELLDIMAVVQAILWHRGHFELAGLLSAVARPNTEEMHLTANESRARVPKDTVEAFTALYPFVRRQSGKQKNTRQQTAAEVAVDSITRMFAEYDWRLTLPTEWVGRLTQNNKDRYYAVPYDIKIKMAELALVIGKRTL